MPHIDKRSGAVVIRIVYDGEPEAGKTTNIQQLSRFISLQRKGELKSPGTHGARTEFFDWLDFTGGFVDGRRVQCQLVSVPGQSQLLHRRRYLLETADAVVYVSDSRRETLEASVHSLKTTLSITGQAEGVVPVGVVWQANKQDLPDAIAVADLPQWLQGLDIPVVGSVAETGEGVMQTFILAVRLATDRVRALLLKEDFAALPEQQEGPDMLYQAMLAVEVGFQAEVSLELRQSLPVQIQEQPVTREPAEDCELVSGAVEPQVEKPPRRSVPLYRRNRVPEQWPELPQATEIASGHIWPPVKGRASIVLATTGQLQVPDTVQPWAPADALEWHNASGWVLHTTERWFFETKADAWRALLMLVRQMVTRADNLPDGRTLVVASDGRGWRLWLITPGLPSVVETVMRAVENNSVADLANCVERTVVGLQRLQAAGIVQKMMPAGIWGFADDSHGPLILSIEEPEGSPHPEFRAPLSDFIVLLEGAMREETQLRSWLDTRGSELFSRALEEHGSSHEEFQR